MKKIAIVLLLACIIFVSGCVDEGTTDETKTEETQETKTEDYTFTQVITYENENSTIRIIKNKLFKTATIEMNVFYEESFIKTPFGDLTNFTTTISCGLMSIAFFNQTALEEFNNVVEKWNSMDATITDDSPPEEKEEKPQENPLEGYEVTEVHLYLRDKSTKNKFSECKITGTSKSDIDIKIY